MIGAINASLITALQTATSSPRAGASVLTLSDGTAAGSDPVTIFGTSKSNQPTFTTTEAFLSVAESDSAGGANGLAGVYTTSSLPASEAEDQPGALLDIVT